MVSELQHIDMSIYRENNDRIEFSLSKQSYASFDASSLKEMIIERLNSNNVFTDQNYEGSNMNAFIDIISYAYHVLLFYLNQTSNETLFSESQIYENINRIVKSLDYRPTGVQTSTLSIKSTGTEDLSVGTYTIPRYSYIDVGGYRYSFKDDVTFVKTTSGEQNIEQITDKILLYQGNYIQYPQYTATGEPNEILTIVPGDGVNIDHFSIDVYVLEGGSGGSYYKYDTATSLFFEKPSSRKVEIRLNENKRYEIKFGNDINGKKLKANDIVMIYYLASNGQSGQINAGDAVNKSVTLYSSTQYDTLLSSNNIKGTGVQYIAQSSADRVLISNTEPSTIYYTGETVENIRENAPKIFNSQYRLVSIEDYENFVKTNYSNFIANVKAIDNNTYLDTHVKYYYDLGVTKPNVESRVLYNQVMFSTSCNFNNIYLYCVPRLEKTTSITQRNNYLLSAQKELIINNMQNTKSVTTQPIIMDPVYVSVDIGVRQSDEQLSTDNITTTKLMLVQEDSSRANSNDMIQKVVDIFKNYFNTLNTTIGMTVDITQLSNNILSTPGVSTFYTYRDDIPNVNVEGLSLTIWNPVYDIDITQTTQNIKLPVFKFPFFNDIDTLANKIVVLRASDAIQVLGTNTSTSASNGQAAPITGQATNTAPSY